MLNLLIVALALVSFSAVAQPKGKNTSIEDAIRDEIRDEVGLDDKQTGPGRPDDPGAHGRENAEQKQRENPGKGSKGGDDDWEDRIRDAIDDDDDDRKDNDKHKDKKKGGKNKSK
jgi:hypothetical protein